MNEMFGLAMLVKVTAILLAGFAGAAALRRRSASARHVVWATTLLGTLAAAGAATLFPPLALEVLPTTSSAGPPAEYRQWSTPGIPLAADRVGTGIEAERSNGSASPAAPRRRPFATGLYTLGLFLVAGYFAAGLVRIRRLTRRARRFDRDAGSRAAESGDRLTLRGQTERPLDLRRTAALEVPVTWGVFRPVVLVPDTADEWSPALWHLALAHEAAHVDRLDWLTLQLAHVACALFWFHPLVWLAARQLALEAERSCDDRVLAGGVAPADYATELCSLSRRVLSKRMGLSAPLAGIAFARRTQLFVRIDAILEPRTRRNSMSRERLVTTLTLALFAPVLVGLLTLAPAREAHADPAQGVSDLVRAAAAGNLERVDALLVGGANANEVDPRRPGLNELPRTPLAAASRGGHLAIVTRLLDSGADVELAPRGEATALMQAAVGGHVSVVNRLIAAGAELDREIDGDGTALIFAARGGHRDVVDVLVAHGADPDLAVQGDGSPLIAASRSGSVEATRALLDGGADPSRAVRGDGNPLIAAVDGGDLDVARALISAGADVDASVRGDGSALIRAAGRGDVDLIAALLDAGAEIDRGVHGDGNALIAAARRGHLEAVRLLLERGAEVDRIVPGDENALIGAAGAGHLDVVQALVYAGADVSRSVLANGDELRTPLNQALRGGHDDVADWLRSAGAGETAN